MTPAHQPVTDRRGFHLNKGISIEAIIAFLALLIGGLTYVFHQDGRTTRNEEAIGYLKEQDRLLRADIMAGLERIEKRLDAQDLGSNRRR